MSVEACDKSVARILRKFTNPEMSSDVLRKLQDNLYKAIRDEPQGFGEALIGALEAVRDYWHETSRLAPEHYANIVRELLRLGATQCAEGCFAHATFAAHCEFHVCLAPKSKAGENMP